MHSSLSSKPRVMENSPTPSKSKNVKVVYKYFKRVDEDVDDGSQAWCIVICCFLINVLVMGFLKCLGILIIELMKTFKATQSDVAILVSVTTCLNCVAGPLACYLVVRFTARTIAFVGTVMVSVGLMLSWFATSMNFLYITIGVFTGFGSGLTYSPGVILIGNYFQKNRGMANGVVVTGSPVGGMLMPYMLNFLIRYLDCRGALLILGGLMMNAVVCTLSYRPYQKEKTQTRVVDIDSENRQTLLKPKRTEGFFHIPNEEEVISTIPDSSSSDSEGSSGPEFIEVELPSGSQLKNPMTSSSSVIVYKLNERYGKCSKPHRIKSNKTDKVSQDKPPLWLPSEPIGTQRAASASINNDRVRCKSVFLSGTGQNIESKQSQTHIHTKKEQLKVETDKVLDHPFSSHIRQSVEQIRRKSNLKASGIGQSSSPTTLGHFHPTTSGLQKDLSGMGSMTSSLRNRKPIRELGRKKDPPSTSTKKLSPYILSLDHSCVIMWSNDDVAKIKEPNITSFPGSMDSINDDDVPGPAGDTEVPGDTNVETASIPALKKPCCSRRIANWIQTSPLHMPLFLILMFSNSATAIATTNILLLIPALGEYRGLSKAEYSTVYLVISMTDMCSRLLGAFISDRGLLSSKLLFSGGLFFAGLSSVIMAFCDSFLKMCLICAVFGLSSGFHIGIYGTFLAEIIGIELLHVGYALCMILNGVLQFAFINISGKILSANREAFTYLYIFYGITLIGGGLLWIIPSIFFKSPKEKTDVIFDKNMNDNEAKWELCEESVQNVKVLNVPRGGKSIARIGMSNFSLQS